LVQCECGTSFLMFFKLFQNNPTKLAESRDPSGDLALMLESVAEKNCMFLLIQKFNLPYTWGPGCIYSTELT
jgi:hypothetical protein